MKSENPILQNMNDPSILEQMYRKHPKSFETDFWEAWKYQPDSTVLAVWRERLLAESVKTPPLLPSSDSKGNFLKAGLLSVLCGITGRVAFLWIKQEVSTPVNLVFIVFAFLTFYFLWKNKPGKKIVFALCALLLFSGVYLNLLPLEERDSVILSYLHLPVFWWMMVGVAFTGSRFRQMKERIGYIRFNVEFGLLYASMAVLGMLVTGLTLSLFSLIGMDISQLYFENVVLFGAMGLSILAAFFASKEKGFSGNLVAHLAKIFSPLILATLLVYLVAVIGSGSNPFVDRNFLITFNGILLFVLAVTLFFIAEVGEYDPKLLFDYVHVSLIGLALGIDTVAFSAIAFRLSSYGITPNRLAVLGLNSIVWIHLAWILISYLRFLRNKTTRLAIQVTVTKYLPVYGLWAATVAFLFPFIFPY